MTSSISGGRRAARDPNSARSSAARSDGAGPSRSRDAGKADKLGHVRDTVKAGGLVSRRHLSKGDAVRELQSELRAKGAKIEVDGRFGPKTEAAVRSFQASRGIKVDGLVGPQTLGQLDKPSSKPAGSTDSYSPSRPQPGAYGARPPARPAPQPWAKPEATAQPDAKPEAKPDAKPEAKPEAATPVKDALSQMDPATFKKMERRAVALHDAIDGLGTDEAAVYKSLDGLSSKELSQLESVYADHFKGSTLRGDIEGDFSGEGETRALLHLDGKHGEANAIGLHRELNPEGGNPNSPNFADGEAVSGLLEGKSAAEVKSIREAYQARYGRSLDADVGGHVFGAERDVVKAQLAADDGQRSAVDLHNALNGGVFGGADESQVKKQLAGMSDKQTAAMNKAYEDKYGHSLRSDLKKKLDGPELDYALAVTSGDPADAGAARIRDELDNLVMRDKGAIESMLAGKTQTQRKQIMAAYKREYGADMRSDLRGKLGTEAYTRVNDLLTTGKLNPARDIYKATHGLGTDEKLLLNTLKGKSEAQIDQLRDDLQKLYGQDLDQVVDSELSGRDAFEAKMLMKGRPENLAQAMAQLDERYDFERGKGDGFMSGLTDTFFGHGEVLDVNHARVTEAYRIARADGKITADERQRLGQLMGYTGDDVNSYAAAKDSVADAATNAAATTVGVTAAIASLGTASPFVIAAGSTLLGTGSKVGLNKGIRGDAYGGQDIATDVTAGLLDFASGQTAGKVAGAAGQAWRGSTQLSNLGTKLGLSLTGDVAVDAVQTGLEWGTKGAIDGIIGAGLDSDTYQNGFWHGAGNVFDGAVGGVGDGLVTGATERVRDTAAQRAYQRVFHLSD